MRIRRAGAGLIAAVVALVPMLVSQPAQALTSDILIQKVRTGPAAIMAGTSQTTSFEITVTNRGLLPEWGVFVDRMDEGLVIDSIEPQTAGLDCDQRPGSDTEFICHKLLLGLHSATAKVTVHAPAATRAGAYENCAGVGITFTSPWPSSVCNPDEESGLPEVTAAVNVKNDADLAVTATTTSNTIDPGTNTTVDVGVTNNGPSDATGPVTVTTPLPAGLTLISGSAPWSCFADPSNVVECSWNPGPPPIAADAPQQVPLALFPVATSAPTLTLTLGTAKPATVGSYDVTSTAASQSPDSTPANDSATATILVTPVDLAIAKQGTGTFQLNQNSTWNLTVSNVGTIEDAALVTVTDTLAPGLQFVSASGSGWTCGNSGQTVTCTKTGLALSANDVIAITAKVTSGNASFDNTATVATASFEQNKANNSTSATAKATPVDLALSKSAMTDPVSIGGSATWKITVSNQSAIADHGEITVTDDVPSRQTVTSAGGDHFNCSQKDQTLTCTHSGSSFAANTSEEITITTQVNGGGPTATNTAVVATTSYEANTANNSATADMSVRREAQSAKPLPKAPTKVKSGRTDQGQKIRTRVMCRPLKRAVAGQASYCKVTRKGQYVKIKVIGDTPMKVKVIQTAKGTDTLKPFRQKKTYIVRP